MSNPQFNWKDKLEQLEKEINKSLPINSQTSTNYITTVKNWFATLPNVGKIIVGLFGIVMVLSLLKTFFSLINLVFSFAVFAVIFYFVYQFVIKSKN